MMHFNLLFTIIILLLLFLSIPNTKPTPPPPKPTSGLTCSTCRPLTDPHLCQPPLLHTWFRESFSRLKLKLTPHCLHPSRAPKIKDRPAHLFGSRFGPSHSLRSFLPRGFARAVPSARCYSLSSSLALLARPSVPQQRASLWARPLSGWRPSPPPGYRLRRTRVLSFSATSVSPGPGTAFNSRAVNKYSWDKSMTLLCA